MIGGPRRQKKVKLIPKRIEETVVPIKEEYNVITVDLEPEKDVFVSKEEIDNNKLILDEETEEEIEDLLKTFIAPNEENKSQSKRRNKKST